MNEDRIEGAANDLGGKAKETLGDALGSEKLKSEGMADQVCGKAQKAFGEFTEAAEPFVAKVRDFVKENPIGSVALAGVLGAAIIGSVRASQREDA